MFYAKEHVLTVIARRTTEYPSHWFGTIRVTAFALNDFTDDHYIANTMTMHAKIVVNAVETKHTITRFALDEHCQ